MEIKNAKETISANNADLAGSVFDNVNRAGVKFHNVCLKQADFNDVALTGLFMLLCLAVVWWIFRTGYRIKN